MTLKPTACASRKERPFTIVSQIGANSEIKFPDKKLTEVSYFFGADYYGDIREEIWYKENAREINMCCKSYGTIDLSFKIAIG